MNRQQRRRLRPSRKRRTIAGLSFLAVATVASGYGQLLRSSIAYASTTCTVDNSTDSAGYNSPGQRTLRYCVGAVQADPSGGTINFSGVTTITLSSRLPYIEKDTTISGGSGVAIRGDGYNGGFGFLFVNAPFTGKQLSIQGLTLTAFTPTSGDGVVYNGRGGTVNITDSTFSGNYGAYTVFVGNYGAELNVSDSTFSSNTSFSKGGAISVAGDLNVSDPTFTGNQGSLGGAIFVNGASYSAETVISGSSFIGNHAEYGGALYMKSRSSPWSVESSTFIGNSASSSSPNVGSGGAIYSNSTAGGVITNSFISGNTSPWAAAVYTMQSGTTIALNFTTVSGNVSQNPGDVYGGANTEVTIQGSLVSSSGSACAIDPSATLDDTFAVATDGSCGLSGVGSVSSASQADLSLDDSASQTVNGVVQTFQVPGADSILVTGAPTSDLDTGISTDQVGLQRTARFTIGSRQFVVPPDPNPPAPSPVFPASEPRAVQAIPGDRSAGVSWIPPVSSGSFPISTYKVVASPGGGSCLAVTPALTCTVTGLANDRPYTFTVSALNGAGWSPESASSNAVTPRTPQRKSIMIVGSRSVSDPGRVEVRGSTQGLEGEQVAPWIRFPGQTSYTEGSGVRSVDDRGTFAWSRKTGKKIYVYFTSGETTSNRISIPAK